jgi:hypothetical protein
MVRMHRYVIGALSGQIVDHVNSDRLDNRKSNLRIVTASQNNQNRAKLPNTTSKYIGVHKPVNGSKWVATIVGQHLGRFTKEIDAAWTYDQACLERFGPQARINGVERPLDYCAPIKRPLNPHGKLISLVKGKFVVRIHPRDGVKGLHRSFETLEEAVKFREQSLAAIENSQDESKEVAPILRNCDGVAIIPMRNSSSEVLVDDDDWHRLMQWTWHQNQNGYAARGERTCTGRVTILMHRWLLNVEERGVLVDHINRQRVDNRKANLRRASYGLNAHNKSRKLEKTTSSFFNVTANCGRWAVVVTHNGTRHHAGLYDDENVAGWAADCMARDLYGADARLNGVIAPPGWIWVGSRAKKVASDGTLVTRRYKRKKNANSRSGFLGVHIDGSRYAAVLQHQKRQLYLGVYDSATVAAWVYDCKKRQLYGDEGVINDVAQPEGWAFENDRGVYVGAQVTISDPELDDTQHGCKRMRLDFGIP